MITGSENPFSSSSPVISKEAYGSARTGLDATILNKRIEIDYAEPPTVDRVHKQIDGSRHYPVLDITMAFELMKIADT